MEDADSEYAPEGKERSPEASRTPEVIEVMKANAETLLQWLLKARNEAPRHKRTPILLVIVHFKLDFLWRCLKDDHLPDLPDRWEMRILCEHHGVHFCEGDKPIMVTITAEFVRLAAPYLLRFVKTSLCLLEGQLLGSDLKSLKFLEKCLQDHCQDLSKAKQDAWRAETYLKQTRHLDKLLTARLSAEVMMHIADYFISQSEHKAQPSGAWDHLKPRTAKRDGFQHWVCTADSDNDMYKEAVEDTSHIRGHLDRATIEKEYAILDERCKQKSLVDLHAHLMGMGSHRFWVDEIMEDLLPEEVKEQTDKPLVLSVVTLSLDKQPFEEALIRFFKSQLPHTWEHFDLKAILEKLPVNMKLKERRKLEAEGKVVPLVPKSSDFFVSDALRKKMTDWSMDKKMAYIESKFSWDVVYDSYELHKAMGIPVGNEILHIKEYVVFNCRRREFQLLSGVSNDDLVHRMSESLELRECIRAAFTIPSRKKNISQGFFTPDFYPRSFALKDCICEQRPLIMGKLLSHLCKYYSDAGVGYVELSISATDVLHADIWHHLHDAMKGTEAPKVRFLACWNRSSITLNEKDYGAGDPEALEKLKPQMDIIFPDPTGAINSSESEAELEKAYPEVFHESGQLRQLEILFETETLGDQQQTLRDYILKYVVGLDLVGDERFHPGSFLHHSRFIGIVKALQDGGNPRAGIRLHYGEWVPHKDSKDWPTYMTIAMRCIKATFKKLQATRPEEERVPLRIGHGVKFLEGRTDDHFCEFRDFLKKRTSHASCV